MFRSKLLFALMIALFIGAGLFSAAAQADESSATSTEKKPAVKKKRHPRRRLLITLDYISWAEKGSASLGGQSQAFATNLFGNALGAEGEFFNSLRTYYALSGALIYGNADVGGTQTNVPYHAVDQHWMGMTLSPRWGYRWSSEVQTSIGPMALYRSLDLPAGATGASATTGAAVNFGVTADAKVYLLHAWLVRFELGTLLSKASTYWVLGIGYRI